MRPSGPIPNWSSDANYPVSGDPWSATATKVDPGGGVANGFKPKSKAPAQFFNWLLNRLALFLLAYDGIDAQNWVRMGAPAVIGAVVAGTRPIALDPITNQTWVAGDPATATTLVRSFNGLDWVDETGNLPAAPYPVVQLCFSSIDGSLWTVGGAGNGIMFRNNVSVWTKTTIVAQHINTVDFWATEALPFLFGGETTTLHPATWRGNLTSGSFVLNTLTNAATYTGEVVAHVRGPNRSVAFALCSAPVAETRQWDVDIWANAWVDRGRVFPIGVTPKGLAYGAADDLYMVTTDAGTVYVSQDGITWTLRATLAGTVFFATCLAVYGAVWFAVASRATNGTAKYILWSVDKGVTWYNVPYPSQQTATPICMAVVQDCIAVICGTSPEMALSMRAR